MTTRRELTEALRVRYSSAPLIDRIKILDEFVALTGYHRKHAIRVVGREAADAGFVGAEATDFKMPEGQKGSTFFFDVDNNGRMGACLFPPARSLVLSVQCEKTTVNARAF